MSACRICGNAGGNAVFLPKEMMFGSREEFAYFECARCGCLQIAAIPADLAKYYPRDGYYSYKPPREKRNPAWALALRERRTRHFLGEATLIGALAAALSKRSAHFDWFQGRGLRLDSRFLDVGCGAGELLMKLRREGFTSLEGADPLIAQDIDYGNGVRIARRGAHELAGQYDFVMLHHSFEHLPDPAAALRALAPRLAEGGTLLLRLPVADSWARRHYGVNWVAWDAPRHLYLHTRKSMALLAEGAGLAITGVVCDSSGQQFSSSELYLRGVPYGEHGKYRPDRKEDKRADAFSQEQWDDFQRRAAELNAKGEGDSACFYLAKR